MVDHFIRRTSTPFNECVARIVRTLKQQGLVIATTLDMKEIFASNLNVRFRNYSALIAYSPELSYQAISLESHSSPVLAWNIVVQEHENGEVEISTANPVEMIGKLPTNSLTHVITDLSDRLRKALDEMCREDNEPGSLSEPSSFAEGPFSNEKKTPKKNELTPFLNF